MVTRPDGFTGAYVQAAIAQAQAADDPKEAVESTTDTIEVVIAGTLQSMLSTQQLSVFVRDDMRMDWSVMRAANDFMELGEPEFGLSLGLSVRFK
jgi:hypothetical protein